jgi:hypothetical protein
VVVPDHHDPGVGAWRVGPDVAHASIERQQQPGVSRRTCPYRRVLGATESLGPCRIDPVTGATQDRQDRVGQVLVTVDADADAVDELRTSMAPVLEAAAATTTQPLVRIAPTPPDGIDAPIGF